MKRLKQGLMGILAATAIGCASVPVKDSSEKNFQHVYYSKDGYTIIDRPQTFSINIYTAYSFDSTTNLCTLTDYTFDHVIIYDYDCNGDVDALFFEDSDTFIRNPSPTVKEDYNSRLKQTKEELNVEKVHREWEQRYKP